MVKEVERLNPKLQLLAFRKVDVLRQRQVAIEVVRPRQIRHVGGAGRSGGCRSKARRVQVAHPVGRLLVRARIANNGGVQIDSGRAQPCDSGIEDASATVVILAVVQGVVLSSLVGATLDGRNSRDLPTAPQTSEEVIAGPWPR